MVADQTLFFLTHSEHAVRMKTDLSEVKSSEKLSHCELTSFFFFKEYFFGAVFVFRIDAAFLRTQKTQGVISNADALLPLSSVFTLPAKEKCVMEITFENLSTNTVFK